MAGRILCTPFMQLHSSRRVVAGAYQRNGPLGPASTTAQASPNMQEPLAISGQKNPRPQPGQGRNTSQQWLSATPDGAGRIDHRHTYRVAILGPGTVVVAHLVSEDLAQGEPGVAGTLADTAVGNDRFGTIDPDAGIQLTQFINRLEGTVRGHRRAPGHVHRTRNVSGTYRQLLHPFGSEHPTAVFVRGTDIDQSRLLLPLGYRNHIGQAGTQRLVTLAQRDIARGMAHLAGGQRTTFLLPLHPAPIQQLDVLHAVDVKYPGSPGGEPVVVVAIQDDGAVF